MSRHHENPRISPCSPTVAVVWIGVLGLAACFKSVSVDASSIKCQLDDDCPAGYTCTARGQCCANGLRCDVGTFDGAIDSQTISVSIDGRPFTSEVGALDAGDAAGTKPAIDGATEAGSSSGLDAANDTAEDGNRGHASDLAIDLPTDDVPIDAPADVPVADVAPTRDLPSTDDAASCAEGTLCVPSGQPCHIGAQVCSKDACQDTGISLPNGTSCGTDKVCSAGACVACKADLACAPTNPCKVGLTSCDTGTSVCTESRSVANGTSCGANLVCNGGACVTCRSGDECTPATACHLGALVCSSGTPTCSETGALSADGTKCGAGMVCRSGRCVACVEGAICTSSSDPCHVGKTSCATGASVCVPDALQPVANGTSCGADKVCLGGSCGSCVAGMTCTAPADPCHAGKTSCATGTSACVTDATQPIANGSSCGSDKVCFNGACSDCAAGGSCTPADCQTGTYSCSTGSRVCSKTGNAVPGTSCGSSTGTCDAAGGCVTCTAGGPCSVDACKAGFYVCSSGVRSCSFSNDLPDGTACGEGVCKSGACTTKKAYGESCTYGWECATASCDGSKCTATCGYQGGPCCSDITDQCPHVAPPIWCNNGTCQGV